MEGSEGGVRPGSFPADLGILRVRYVVEGHLENLTAIRVGAGRSSEFGSVDNPLLVRGARPYLPGSSIKGALRSAAEVYARSLGYKVLTPDELLKVLSNDCNRDRDCLLQRTADCPTCILFGSPAIAGRISIGDAIARDDEYRISIRTMVSINRLTGAQLYNHLYTLDYVEPGARFDFRMELLNVDLEKAGRGGSPGDPEYLCSDVAKYVLRALEAGNIQLGGKRTAGFGRVRLRDAKVTVQRPGGAGLELRTLDLDELLR
ncbi:MAG: type III CRISPR-associated RAMP protein Csx7 [Conexivisphaera sp.]|jgi:CRISPR-associated RAMP protein (TIGR02581 family)